MAVVPQVVLALAGWAASTSSRGPSAATTPLRIWVEIPDTFLVKETSYIELPLAIASRVFPATRCHTRTMPRVDPTRIVPNCLVVFAPKMWRRDPGTVNRNARPTQIVKSDRPAFAIPNSIAAFRRTARPTVIVASGCCARATRMPVEEGPSLGSPARRLKTLVPRIQLVQGRRACPRPAPSATVREPVLERVLAGGSEFRCNMPRLLRLSGWRASSHRSFNFSRVARACRLDRCIPSERAAAAQLPCAAATASVMMRLRCASSCSVRVPW